MYIEIIVHSSIDEDNNSKADDRSIFLQYFIKLDVVLLFVINFETNQMASTINEYDKFVYTLIHFGKNAEQFQKSIMRLRIHNIAAIQPVYTMYLFLWLVNLPLLTYL